MNITAVNFNSFQYKQIGKSITPAFCVQKNNTLNSDTVSFSGLFDVFKKEKTEQPQKTLNDLVPKHKGIVYKKIRDEKGQVIEKIPVEVDIVKIGASDFEFEIDKKLIGGVRLGYFVRKGREDAYNELRRNYKKEGIKGDRIIAEYVYNCHEEEYGGIGHLADLVEVAACKELEIEPNVVSLSMTDAAPLHYLRGKRFVPFRKYNKQYNWYYNRKNPNAMVKEIIENTPKGQKFDTSKIKHCFLTYMPKEMIKNLEAELEKHPIF